MKCLAPAVPALLITACGSATHIAASPVTVTVTETVTAYPTGTQTVGETPSPLPGPKTVLDRFGGYQAVIDNDGIYIVGVDIPSGAYRNAGGTQCYWARLRSVDSSDVIDSRTSSSPQLVEIRRTDTAFATRDCGTWQMAP